MKATVVEDADVTTYVVVCDIGDEALDTLTQFARAKQLKAAHITPIGSFEHATVGRFDRAAKTYRPSKVDQQCEPASLLGDVAMGEDGPSCTCMRCSAYRTGQPAEDTSSRARCSRPWRPW
jgi:predicted DNA-binding protein with PD1-like motif